ncbi:MAG: PD-(D/E)XK nuclease family protein [Planctomycetota bacterium]|nr:PD-(D/E)XK nuclease family protein [Planctomycetota bacterium]
MPAVLDPERSAQPRSRPVTSTRPHWSYSQISQFLRCHLSYYFERILKLERPCLPASMVLGSSVHEALAAYHQCLQAKKPVPAGRVQGAFLNAWHASEDRQPIQFKDKDTRDDVLAQGIGLLELYLQEPPPQDIVVIEESMMVPLFTSRGKCLGKPLIAVVDLLHRDQHGLLVSEFKTSGRRYSELETEMALQAVTYTHAVRERYDEKPGVRYVVLVKTKKPQVHYLDTVRTESDINRLGDVVQTIERAIQAEAFYPVETMMNCSGCSFYRQFREWRGTSSRSGHENEQREAAC